MALNYKLFAVKFTGRIGIPHFFSLIKQKRICVNNSINNSSSFKVLKCFFLKAFTIFRITCFCVDFFCMTMLIKAN